MVIEELSKIPADARRGPLIVGIAGLPYAYGTFRDLWRRCADRAGIKSSVWNRDLRAAGVTEAREAAAPTDDAAKVAGHANKRTTARVYDRDHLEAHRRVMKARIAHRAKDGG
jgi:integrase